MILAYHSVEHSSTLSLREPISTLQMTMGSTLSQQKTSHYPRKISHFEIKFFIIVKAKSIYNLINIDFDLMECELCYEEFNRCERLPKVLAKCGHTFCETCVSQIVQQNQLSCPYCRYKIQIGKEDYPPNNFALL